MEILKYNFYANVRADERYMYNSDHSYEKNLTKLTTSSDLGDKDDSVLPDHGERELLSKCCSIGKTFNCTICRFRRAFTTIANSFKLFIARLRNLVKLLSEYL